MAFAFDRLAKLPSAEARDASKGFSMEEISDDSIAEYTLAVHLESQFGELAEAERANPDLAQEIRETAKQTLYCQYEELQELKPDLIVLSQGFGIHATAARLLAARMNIPVLAFENTALKNKVVWDSISGVTVHRNMAANFHWRHMDALTDEEVSSYCASTIANTKKTKQEEHASPDRQWKGKAGRRMILYLGQVYTDSSLLYGARPGLGPEQVVTKLAEYCETNKVDLVLKLHPKEASEIGDPVTWRKYEKLTYRKLRELERFQEWNSSDWMHIDADNQWDTYGLIDAASVVVTINSQAGLEAAIRKKPVITCGRCFYANLDFTVDIHRPDDFNGALRFALDKPMNKDQHLAAEKFFYVFFEKYCIEKSTDALLRKIRLIARSNGFF